MERRTRTPKDICTPMFTAALLTTVKTQTQPVFTDERKKKMWCIYVICACSVTQL